MILSIGRGGHSSQKAVKRAEEKIFRLVERAALLNFCLLSVQSSSQIQLVGQKSHQSSAGSRSFVVAAVYRRIEVSQMDNPTTIRSGETVVKSTFNSHRGRRLDKKPALEQGTFSTTASIDSRSLTVAVSSHPSLCSCLLSQRRLGPCDLV